MLPKGFTYKNTALYIFAIASFLYLFTLNVENTELLLINKMAIVLPIIIYYLTSIKTINYYFLVTLLLFLISGIIFSINRKSVSGFYVLLLSRILLFIGIYKKIKFIDRKFFTAVLSIFLIVASIILSMVYINSHRFNIAILIAIVSILIFSLSFSELSKTSKKGNLEMLIGISLFLFCDILFSLNRLVFFEANRLAIISIFYHSAYYFISTSMIKKSQVT